MPKKHCTLHVLVVIILVQILLLGAIKTQNTVAVLVHAFAFVPVTVTRYHLFAKSITISQTPRKKSGCLLPKPTAVHVSALHSAFDANDANKIKSSTKEMISVNILCLHGKGNNGKAFQKVLAPLEDKIRMTITSATFQFHYLDAPFQMRTEDGETSQYQLQWWTLPPGVRSFNAEEYKGFEQSSKLVEDALNEKDYHFIIGHSQGAILLSALMTCESWTKKVFGGNEDDDDATKKKEPLGYVLNGCAWPNPYSNQLETYQYQSSSSLLNSEFECEKPEVLFVIGGRDKVNPPEGAERVRKAMIKGGLRATTCNHEGGHSVPVNDEEALDAITHWISEEAKRIDKRVM